MKLVCLPQHLTELVLGRLLTEQIITSSEDVDHIYICEYGKRAKVYLKNSARNTQSSSDAFVEVTPTCCTGNHILNDYFVTSKEPQSLTPIFWKPEWIFHMADAFADGSPLHGITFATHSCILAQKDHILFSCEDIGRHNALDKVKLIEDMGYDNLVISIKSSDVMMCVKAHELITSQTDRKSVV